ncbi:hypothetical protein [Desulfobulbus elongatus]|uniref:hypothetical protein n=1 Tax=Desulfobulbus elongatus TaxID=53332 RepID=UPI000686DA13|nr:hypothetical protein [Desulfobulbus elongatus]
MKYLATATGVITILLTMLLGEAAAGVSISVGEPGFYGRIDIGNFPQPRLVYAEPIIVRRVTTWYPPIYLRVPPAHVKHWYKHCNAYNACGRPVYFVDDAWYRDVYAPRYREHHRVVVPPPPPRRPTYYEYRKYEHRPPKKVYIRDERPKSDHRRDHRDDHRGRR